jgi:hypothetical protein
MRATRLIRVVGLGQRGIRSPADPSDDPGTHPIDLLPRGRYGRSGIGHRPDDEKHVPRHGGDDGSVSHGSTGADQSARRPILLHSTDDPATGVVLLTSESPMCSSPRIVEFKER